MRHISNDKYTIAWFKLAECVAKGEKEKAIGVYRLLMHSLDDHAYAHQLEGDLLHAFNDQRCDEKYASAAHLYFIQKKYKEAATLYHQLVCNAPDHGHYLKQAVTAYKNFPLVEVAIERLKSLFQTVSKKKVEQPLHYFITLVFAHENDAIFLPVAYTMMLGLIQDGSKDDAQKTRLLEHIMKQVNSFAIPLTERNAFLSEVKEVSSHWYEFIAQLI